GRTVVTMALDQENPALLDILVEHLPTSAEWNLDAVHLLRAALSAGRKDEVRALLAKHSSPPVPEGKHVPLLAYAIASNDLAICRTLIDCGADPNTLLPDKCDPDFLALLP